MKIIGFDPGTARVGWAVVTFEKSQILQVSFGCLTTLKTDDVEIRLLSIFKEAETLIHTHKPDSASIEELFYTNNAKTVIPVGQARGVLLLACARAGIPVVSYSPRAIKRTVTGDGNANKAQMQFMIKKLLKLSRVPQPDDAADAIAIALTHAYSERMQTVIL